MSQMNPCQSTVPMQTSQNNFQAYRQANGNQQSTQCSGCPGNPQGQCTQSPFGQFYQQQESIYSQQPRYPCTTQLPANPNNFYQGPYQNVQPPPAATAPMSCNVPSPMQTQATNCGALPQNIIDQIRACLANTAPIFILPGGCQQQPVVPTQQATSIPGPLTGPGYQPSPVPNYVPQPSFYPIPVPFPMFDPFGGRPKEQQKNCGCSLKTNTEAMGLARQCLPSSCFYNAFQEEEEHRCTETTDDTICSKRNCPSAISLQALASQLLSIQGIVSCTATRLILRKIPGSNITSTMEDTMERAQRSISVLNKDQLLGESRNAQQVNALINLHMTASPPTNIIPILTLLQLKVNVLKAQVENLINRRLMENQGLEVEATDSIDPGILALKTDAELREFLVVLKQKECDERVNMNFAPYRSQRVIAENRLSNLQKKIRQVEGEFERRRCTVAPSPPMSARIVREFAETPCCFSSFGYPGYMSPTTPEREKDTQESPDPFAITLRCPRKLRLKPHVGSPEATYDYSSRKETQRVSSSTEKASQSEPTNDKDKNDCSSLDNCGCYEDESTSEEESPDEDKKKLRLKVDEKGNVTVTSTARLKDVSLMKLAGNVSLRTRKASDSVEKRKRSVKSTSSRIDEEDFPDLALSTVPMLEEISEVERIDDSVSLDPVPNAKMFTRPATESESFLKVPSTFDEAKVRSSEVKDETIVEKKVDENDADASELDDWEFVGDDIDYEKMKQRVVTSSILDIEESRSSDEIDKKIEVKIPQSRFETSTTIQVKPWESEEKTGGYYSRIESLTNDFGESSTSIRDEESTRKLEEDTSESTKTATAFLKIGNGIKSEPKERVDAAESTKTATAFLKIGNGIKSEPKERVDAAESTKTATAFLKIGNGIKSEPKVRVDAAESTKTATAFLKIGNGIKSEPKERVDAAESTKTATAFLKIGNGIKSEPKERVDAAESTKTATAFLKIGNGIKSEPKERVDAAEGKKRFVTTATIRFGPSESTRLEDVTTKVVENNENSSTNEEDTSTVATLTIGGKPKFPKNDDQIVSMLTEIRYDNPEIIAEQLRSALTRNFRSNNDRCQVEEKEEEAKHANSEGNCTVAPAFPAIHFPWRIIDSEKHDNDVERSDLRGEDAFESTIRSRQETELNESNFRPKRVPFVTSDADTSSYFLETGVGLLSNAFSLMSDQIAFFGSVVNKIGLFGGILEGGSKTIDKISTKREEVWMDPCTEYLAVLEDVNRRGRVPHSSLSKRSIKKLDKEERGVIEGDLLRSLRGRLKHSIIKDKDNGKSYVVMLDNSFREHDSRSSPRTNLGRPYKIRRNLLIRSRLKECYARKQNLPPPFTILKRARETNGKSREISPHEEKMGMVKRRKNERDISSLPAISGKYSRVSSKSSGLKVTQESNTRTTVTVFSTDSCASTSEGFPLNVHDY